MGRSKSRKIAPVTPAGPDWRVWLAAAALVLLVAVIYAPAIDNGFIWDDAENLEDNPALKSLPGLRDIWLKPGATPQYYPLTQTSFWIEYHLWQLDPRGYHLVSLLLHAVAAVLVWRVLLRLAVPGAWFAAALFAVHPICVESVAWATERKNLLSCILSLGAMLAYFQFSPPDNPVAASKSPTLAPSRWRSYALALLLYAGALLCKTAVVALPAVLLVLVWWKRGRLTWRDVRLLTPFFAIGLALGCLTIWVEKYLVGAAGQEWNTPLVDRLLIAGRALWFYVGKLLWPDPIVFVYPRWAIDSRAAWQYVFPVAALLAIVGLWLARGRLGRGPMAAVAIFVGLLLPVLGFFNVYMYRFTFVADHLQYQASIALFALAAAALAMIAAHVFPAKTWVVVAAGAAVIIPLAIRSRAQTFAYQNAKTIYEEIIAHNPLCWMAHINLAEYLQRRGDRAAGLACLETAVATFSRLEETDPANSAIFRGRGDLNLRLGKQRQAIADYERAIELDPENREAMNNLAWLLATARDDRLRNGQRAVELARQLDKATSRANPHTLSTLAAAYAEVGDFEAAVAALRQAVELSGEKVSRNLHRELESYEAGHAWREGPAISAEER
jgi:tetratricopeptide (TPR) repeat protein